jgi:hypothetical protein
VLGNKQKSQQRARHHNDPVKNNLNNHDKLCQIV